MTDSLFDGDQATNPTFEDLVGPDKKYKTAQDAARALIEKDRFIEQLKSENETARNEIRARTTLEELADRLATPKAPNGEHRPPLVEPGSNQQDVPAPTDLKAEVARLLAEERNSSNRASNLEKAKTAAKERFGGDYNATLRQIAEELGVSDKFLTDMAASSPTAFTKLIDSVRAPDPNRPIAPPQSNVEAGRVFNNPNVKNKAYYDNLRKTDLNTYMSKRVQQELYKNAMDQGSKFYE